MFRQGTNFCFRSEGTLLSVEFASYNTVHVLYKESMKLYVVLIKYGVSFPCFHQKNIPHEKRTSVTVD